MLSGIEYHRAAGRSFLHPDSGDPVVFIAFRYIKRHLKPPSLMLAIETLGNRMRFLKLAADLAIGS